MVEIVTRCENHCRAGAGPCWELAFVVWTEQLGCNNNSINYRLCWAAGTHRFVQLMVIDYAGFILESEYHTVFLSRTILNTI